MCRCEHYRTNHYLGEYDDRTDLGGCMIEDCPCRKYKEVRRG